MRKIAIVLLCCCAGQVHAQDLLRYEPFDYAPVGGAIEGQTNPDGATWLQAYVATTPPTPAGNITIGSGSLAMPAELGIAVGNSADINFSNSSVATNQNQSGKALRLPLGGATITSGAVYYSMALRIDDLTGVNQLNGGFFVALQAETGATTVNPTNGAAKIQVRTDPTDNTKFNLGIFNNENATAASDSWEEAQLNVSQTYFIVAAYEKVPPGEPAVLNNDISHLWINPSDLGAAVAPTPTESDLSPPASATADLNVGSIILRQSPAPSLTLDELRVGTTWASVTSAAIIPEFDEGDFDEDLDVDADDLALWTGDFGLQGNATHGDGDADGDLDVDGADFLVWQQQLGNVPPPPVAAIPEPAPLLLAMLAVGSVHMASSRLSGSRKR